MGTVLLIALGGGVGAVLRYFVAGWTQGLTAGSFPLGTLTVNVLGCFLIGFLGMVLTEHIQLRPEYRIGLLVGVLGGFTTFSTYGWETMALLRDGENLSAALNLILSNLLGFAGVWLGYRIAEKWYGV